MTQQTHNRIRQVWRMVCHNPGTSYQEMAERLGVVKSTVYRDICYLESCGYVKKLDGCARAIGVLVPFVEVRA